MFPSKELLNYGIATAVLVPVLGFFLWAGRAVVRSLLVHIDEFFKGVLEQQKESSGAMKELAKAFATISERCLACRTDAVSTVRDLETNLTGQFVELTKRFVEVSAAVHDKTFLELAALGTRFDASLTSTAQSIRKDQATMLSEVERKHLEAETKRLREEAEQLREENEELSRPHTAAEGVVRR